MDNVARILALIFGGFTCGGLLGILWGIFKMLRLITVRLSSIQSDMYEGTLFIAHAIDGLRDEVTKDA